MNFEESFKSWGKPPGATEEEKMENTEAEIKKAIAAHSTLAIMDISVFAQGSYKSRTNVKNDSDVDMCICLNSTFFPRYPVGKTKKDYGNTDGSITFGEFKDLVGEALSKYFGLANVKRGNKAFDIKSSTQRVNANAVPALAYRYYYGDEENDYRHPTGIAFDTDDGRRIINWPHHTAEQGKTKHEATGKRYKKVVRVIKKLRNDMQDKGIATAHDIASFMLESLVWNVPNHQLGNESYSDDVKNTIIYCYQQTKSKDVATGLMEVNNLKPLFSDAQEWTHEKANAFLVSAWSFVGFN